MCPEAGLLNAALLILINHHISVRIRILIHHFQKVLDLDPDPRLRILRLRMSHAAQKIVIFR
jgi:hypothetical protein